VCVGAAKGEICGLSFAIIREFLKLTAGAPAEWMVSTAGIFLFKVSFGMQAIDPLHDW
jgi:hypothetical protein